MKTSTAFLSAMLVASAVGGTAPENIARGKSYVFDKKPNYELCTDKGDAVQLTDGEWLGPDKNWFWTSKSVVGWKTGGDGKVRAMTVDLGADEPITGFSWNFGAGRAGVCWPELIFVYVSTDGKLWRFAGDLYSRSKAENGPPPDKGFAIYRARSEKMPCHGRYVTFLVKASNYVFVDEVEVYRGGAGQKTAGDDGEAVLDPTLHFGSYMAFQNFLKDAERIGCATQSLGEADRRKVSEGLMRLNALVLRGKGYDRPFLWACDRWASADPLDIPIGKSCVSKPLEVEMMRGETRSEAVNLSNPTARDIEVEAVAEGFPKGANIELREVVPTVAKSGARIGGLLMGDGAGRVRLRIPSGSTRQVWISFVKPNCPAGAYAGRIVAGEISKPLTLRLAAIDFPKRPRLHVGGWDYTDNPGYYGSTSNLAARLAMMRHIFTDSPWAGSGVAPAGATFDAEGRLTNAGGLDFAKWNEWTGLWGEQARQYCVFMSVKGKFHGEPMGTERFNRMVGEYMRAWHDGVKAKLGGRRIVLLLVDEPFTEEQDAVIIAWAKPIKAKAPEFAIFEDTDYSSPKLANRKLYPVCDIICPPLPDVTSKGSHDFFIRQRREHGKEIWFYSCCGPSRTFDPIVYYRAQAWNAWKCGATGSMFWAFGCGGGIADSFRPFEQPGTEYSPFFVSPTNAFRAKQSEALMEGVEDYEYFAMLADRIAQLKRAGKDVSAAERLLAGAVDRALPDEEWLKGNDYSFGNAHMRYDWLIPRDHVSMDAVRIEVLRALADCPGE